MKLNANMDMMIKKFETHGIKNKNESAALSTRTLKMT